MPVGRAEHIEHDDKHGQAGQDQAEVVPGDVGIETKGHVGQEGVCRGQVPEQVMPGRGSVR